MSKASDIFAKIITEIESLNLGYKRYPNAIAPEQNSELLLKKGYGIGIGPAENTGRLINCKYTRERAFVIQLTKQVTNTENDKVAFETIQKDLLDDHATIEHHFEVNVVLDGIAIKSLWSGDEGIEFLEGDRNKFLLLGSTYLIEYSETI